MSKKEEIDKEEAKQALFAAGALATGLALLGYFIGFFVKLGGHIADIFTGDE